MKHNMHETCQNRTIISPITCLLTFNYVSVPIVLENRLSEHSTVKTSTEQL